MDLIQENGSPQYGRFETPPDHISLDRYRYCNPYGDEQIGWRKKLKFKKFKFCSIQHEQLSLGVAIVDIGWLNHAFFYLYDHATGQVEDWHAHQVLWKRSKVDEQPLYNHSYYYSNRYEIVMEHAHGVRQIIIQRRGELLLSARIFCAGHQALSLCSPNGINGWTYTQKHAALGIEGTLFHNKKAISLNENTLASLDDTCGFLRPETAWFWLSVQFVDQHGRRIGLNLASGVNESLGNENSLWINGKIFALGDVLFERIDQDVWQIRSLCHQVNLTVKTGWRRYEKLNLAIVGSQFSQWQSRVTGVIQLQQEVLQVQLNEQFGLLEQHYAKW